MEWVAILNIVLPQVFGIVSDMRRKDPSLTYEQALRNAGVKIDAEVLRLLAEMAKAVEEGAVPR
jgi:hypothetical protein